MQKIISRSVVSFVALAWVSSTAFASGFEKTNGWGGREAGLGGSVIGSVKGANSIYFNPAGMAGMKGGEVSLNFSPVLSKFSGKAQYLNAQVDGNTTFSPILGLTTAYGVTEKLGLGMGFYVAGGARALQESMDYSTLNSQYDTLRPSTEANVRLLEFAVGPAYEVAPGFKIGMAWRLSMVSADFSFVKEVAPSSLAPTLKVLANINVRDATATAYNGWKFGMQYVEPETQSWGIGATWRTEVGFSVKGTSSGEYEFNSVGTAVGQPAAKQTITGGEARISNKFPMQIALGGFFKVGDQWTLFPGYDFSNYSVNNQLVVSGNVVLGTTTLPLTNVAQGWKNQHVFRMGSEYAGFETWKLRLAYSLTTQVTPDDRARAFISSPGAAHYFDVGGGMEFMDGKMSLDGALEYAFGSGDGSASDDNVTSGSFKSTGYTLHTGVSYRF